MRLTLAIDFGSTFTKVVAIDIDKEEVVCVVQSPSTVENNISLGLETALIKLKHALRVEVIEPEKFLCCSSAAGGLKMVVAGLVPELTTKAAQEACLGAGAKLVASFSNGLIKEDISQIREMGPDIILLTGGTDGGNKTTILENARIVSESELNVPVIIAGNRAAADEAKSILRGKDKFAVIVENVLPQIDKLNVEPTRQAIRDTYIGHITKTKGLDRARKIVGEIIMPTPAAVLNAVSLMAEGTNRNEGLGELILVDIGGATTDVHSVAKGNPTNSGTMVKGLLEPYRKRTVEGDLGLRHNAISILEIAGARKVSEFMPDRIANTSLPTDIRRDVTVLTKDLTAAAFDSKQCSLDIGLACAAVGVAMERHCGIIEEIFLPTGRALIQQGKDLTAVKHLIGTGGIFRYGRMPGWILKQGCFNTAIPGSLRPIDPQLYIDEDYIMFAVGLLAEENPDLAFTIMNKSLKKITTPHRDQTRIK